MSDKIDLAVLKSALAQAEAATHALVEFCHQHGHNDVSLLEIERNAWHVIKTNAVNSLPALIEAAEEAERLREALKEIVGGDYAKGIHMARAALERK